MRNGIVSDQIGKYLPELHRVTGQILTRVPDSGCGADDAYSVLDTAENVARQSGAAFPNQPGLMMSRSCSASGVTR
jgi:hypothetical protein